MSRDWVLDQSVERGVSGVTEVGLFRFFGLVVVDETSRKSCRRDSSVDHSCNAASSALRTAS